MMNRSLLSVMLLVGILSSVPAKAELSIPELKALAEKLDRLSIWDEPECPTQAPFAGQTQVVAFEGAGGYCPRYSYLNLLYGTDGKNLAEKLAATPDSYENLIYTRKIRALISAEDSSKNCFFARSINRVQKGMTPEQRARFDVVYYSKDGEEKAAECVKSRGGSATVKAIGFSMGGYATVQFANLLNKENRAIQNVLTVDPVGKNVLFVTGVFFALDNPFIKRTPNVVNWQNFYQKFDVKSIYDSEYFKLGARGSRVLDADVNQEVNRTDYKSPWELEYAHFGINLTKPVRDALQEVFR